MIDADTILKMIENVDPADRDKLDEIGRAVRDYLEKPARPLPRYTRSRDLRKTGSHNSDGTTSVEVIPRTVHVHFTQKFIIDAIKDKCAKDNIHLAHHAQIACFEGDRPVLILDRPPAPLLTAFWRDDEQGGAA